MPLVRHLYVTRMYSYVIRMYLYVIRMSLVCTRMSFVCHSYVLVCHPYVTRISLVCTCMSSECHSYVLVCHSYITRLWFYHKPPSKNFYVTLQETIQTLLVLAHVFRSLLTSAAIVSNKRNWRHFRNSLQFCKANFYRLLIWVFPIYKVRWCMYWSNNPVSVWSLIWSFRLKETNKLHFSFGNKKVVHV